MTLEFMSEPPCCLRSAWLATLLVRNQYKDIGTLYRWFSFTVLLSVAYLRC